MKIKIPSLLIIFAATLAMAQPSQHPTLPAGTQTLRDIAYVTHGHERQKLDLFVPTGATNPLPLILWIHGGAWKEGSKEGCPALRFFAHGYAVASLNYRLSQDAPFPAQIEDCKAAVRWLRAHAADYHLDPERFGAWGSSAGGHLVALLGTTGSMKTFDVGENLKFSSGVQAVVDFFGPTDLTQAGKPTVPDAKFDQDTAHSAVSALLGGPVKENMDKAAQASPVTYVSHNDPPFLIMHGNQDKLVPYQQSELLRDALQKAGVSVALKIIAGAGHGFGGREIDEQVLAFFNQQLKPVAGK